MEQVSRFSLVGLICIIALTINVKEKSPNEISCVIECALHDKKNVSKMLMTDIDMQNMKSA